jgi:hypothetical protein
MTYLQPFQESSCETWKVGDGYVYSLSSSKKLVPRSSWNFDSSKRMVPRSNSGSDSLKCRNPNLKWEFADAKIEQNWCATMFSGYWFFPQLQVGYFFRKKGCWLGCQYFFGNNCHFCRRVCFQIPWLIAICYMVFEIIF